MTLRNAFIIAAAIACLQSSLFAARQPDWQLIWSDEFDDAILNTNNWNYDYGTGAQYGLRGWGNNELEYYTSRPQNVRSSNGMLVIEARRENFSNCQYTSGRVNTFGKADWLYGRFEIRAQLPAGQGYWPALWLMPSESTYGHWPNSGEIDIMELIGHSPYIVHGSAHRQVGAGGGAFGNAYTNAYGTPDFSRGFHVFALEWYPNKIKWLVDGNCYGTYRRDYSGWPQWPFNKNFYMIINCAVGGNWPGAPAASTPFPQQMLVDYVRVYSDARRN